MLIHKGIHMGIYRKQTIFEFVSKNIRSAHWWCVRISVWTLYREVKWKMKKIKNAYCIHVSYKQDLYMHSYENKNNKWMRIIVLRKKIYFLFFLLLFGTISMYQDAFFVKWMYWMKNKNNNKIQAKKRSFDTFLPLYGLDEVVVIFENCHYIISRIMQ